MKKAIIWLKNDLRIADNPAIHWAIKNNYQLIFLYIFDRNNQKFPIGSASKWFLHYALFSLKNRLKNQYNAQLLLKIGKSEEILHNLVKKYQINAIFYNKNYEKHQISIQNNIKNTFKKQNIQVKEFNGNLLFDPEKITNLSGSYFKVFTPFWKKCLSEISKISPPLKMPDKINSIKLQEDENTNLSELNLLPKDPNWAKNWEKIYKISEDDAHNLAEEFVCHKIKNYDEGRDFPAQNNTSFLSPYLHFGLISSKHVYYKTIPFLQNQNSKSFLSEIGWREFSYHLLYHFKDLPEKNFKPKFNNFPWVNDKSDLKKWQKGQTGFPIIDAGMRQLWQTGWMHNRVRMIVASFLTKNLLIDWRIGQEWFWDCLIDADMAANSASWQWVAGSGCDASPYFRIFNPIIQSKKFDPKGEYIRKWVPELKNLSEKEVHEPKNHGHYPKPMIDLKFSRNRALKIYKTL